MLNPEMHKAKTAHNRSHSPEVLRDMGYRFSVRNNGAHLVVDTAEGLVDLWPGTGLWCHRATQRRGRGVFNMVRLYAPPATPEQLIGEGLTIKREPWMTEFTLKVYRESGFTIVD